MNVPESLFEFEQHGRTLILSPIRNLSELELSAYDETLRSVVRQLRAGGCRNIILDLHRTDYYGSTALRLFIKVWKRIRSVEGDMVFCNVSPHEREVMQLARLDRIWTICGTRDEALRYLSAE